LNARKARLGAWADALGPSRWSLKGRLYVGAAVAVTLAWLGGIAALYTTAKSMNEHMAEETLAHFAHSILAVTEHRREQARADGTPMTPVAYWSGDSRFAYQVWSEQGTLLARSDNAPADRALVPGDIAGFRAQLLEGKEASLFVLRSSGRDLVVQVVDSDDTDLFGGLISTNLLRAFALSMLPVLLLNWALLRRALMPLQTASQELERRSPDVLAPVTVADPPKEMVPLLAAVNGLMERLAQAIARERSFTSLAAHEMRTPLASLRVQAQVVARCTGEVERNEALQHLIQHVDRCSRLLTQLLALARADALTGDKLAKAPLDLGETVADALMDVADEATLRGVNLQCSIAPCALMADKTGLEALLRNLVSNAMRHTPDGGTLAVEARAHDRGLRLSVDDSGPGIPSAERERVLQRFVRGSAERGSGVGLGLSIVAAVARAHGAEVSLGESPLGGLKVMVTFPRP
jgi:signal transduction histidine kinase